MGQRGGCPRLSPISRSSRVHTRRQGRRRGWPTTTRVAKRPRRTRERSSRGGARINGLPPPAYVMAALDGSEGKTGRRRQDRLHEVLQKHRRIRKAMLLRHACRLKDGKA